MKGHQARRKAADVVAPEPCRPQGLEGLQIPFAHFNPINPPCTTEMRIRTSVLTGLGRMHVVRCGWFGEPTRAALEV